MTARTYNELPSRSPKRGYRVKAGTNPPMGGTYATPEWAARTAEPWWSIVNVATGEVVGVAKDFGA